MRLFLILGDPVLENKIKNIAILGSAGSVGSYIAFHLIESMMNQEEVVWQLSLYSGPNKIYNQCIKKNGITLVTTKDVKNIPYKTLVRLNVKLCNTIPSRPHVKQDIVILALKDYVINQSMAEKIVKLSKTNSTIISIQNGLPFWHIFLLKKELNLSFLKPSMEDNAIFTLLGNRNIVCCISVLSNSRSITNDIFKVYTKKVKTKLPAFIFNAHTISSKMETKITGSDIKKILPYSRCSQEYLREMFLKLQINIAFSGISVLEKKTVGELLRSKQNLKLILKLFHEVSVVGKLLNLNLLHDDNKIRSRIDMMNKDHLYSMALDAKLGKQIEYKAIYSNFFALVEQVNRHFNIDLKLVEFEKIYHQLKRYCH